MPNLVEVNYGRTGRSTNTDALGMREMQARAFAARDAQYLLVKAPPASGKSRALMFLALDKMLNQGVSKTIVAVPERSIGSSFASTKLSEHGFYADWEVSPKRDLCSPGGEPQKVKQFQEFLQSDDRILVCTHDSPGFLGQHLLFQHNLSSRILCYPVVPELIMTFLCPPGKCARYAVLAFFWSYDHNLGIDRLLCAADAARQL